MGLEAEMKTELPVFSKIADMEVEVQDGKVTMNSNNFNGVALHKTGVQPGTVAWVLQVTGNTIQVTCGDYHDWDEEWPKAKSYISTVLKLLRAATLNVVAVGCQVIDKFVYSEDPRPYSINDVFLDESELLTKQVKNSGELWHIHQGWFDLPSPDAGSKLLSHLNLSSARLNNNKLTATIDHSMQLIYEQPIAVIDMFGAQDEKSKIDSIFEKLHDTNKSVLKRLLNVQKLREIGLPT